MSSKWTVLKKRRAVGGSDVKPCVRVRAVLCLLQAGRARLAVSLWAEAVGGT